MELEIIQSKIYEIKGCKVMLDRDLAEMYGVTTANLNQAVKRNIARFPEDFMFQLSEDEWNSLRLQSTFLKQGRGQHSKYLPFVFTELGVAMLSSILNSDIAIEINRGIVRAFVTVRQIVLSPPVDNIGVLETEMEELKQYVENMFSVQKDINEKTKNKLKIIRQTLVEMQTKNQNKNARKPKGYITPKEGLTSL